MRTTITISDPLWQEIRLRALETHRTLSEVVEELLRVGLEPRSDTSPRRVILPVAGGEGPAPTWGQIKEILGEAGPRPWRSAASGSSGGHDGGAC